MERVTPRSLDMPAFQTKFFYVITGHFEEKASLSEKLAIAAYKASNGGHMASIETFNLIEDASKTILHRANYNASIGFTPIAEDGQESDISNLVTIVSSIRYNRAFNKFARNLTDITLSYVAADSELVDWMSDWETNRKSRSMLFNVADRLVTWQSLAASMCCGSYFNQPSIELVTHKPRLVPGTNEQVVIGGYFIPDQKIPPHPGTMYLNTHEWATGQSANFASLVFHENFHSIEKDLGVLHALGAFKELGALSHAGNLWHHMAATDSIVPYPIRRAYRQQFHEVAAYDMDERFEKGLKKILSSAPVSNFQLDLV